MIIINVLIYKYQNDLIKLELNMERKGNTSVENAVHDGRLLRNNESTSEM